MNIRKLLFSISLIFTMTFMPLAQAHAVPWGFLDGGSRAVELAINEILDIIKQTGKAYMQIIAIQTVNRFILKTISDVASPYVRNFDEYLIEDPEKKTEVELEGFLTNVLHGQTEGNYVFEFEGDSGKTHSYEFDLKYAALGKDGGNQAGSKKSKGVTISDHCISRAGEIQMFGTPTKRSFNCFSSVFSNIHNHPTGIKIVADAARTRIETRLKEIAKTEATVAEGALSKKDADGNIIRPSSSIKQTLVSAQQFTYDAIGTVEVEHPIAKSIVSASLPSLLAATNKALDRKSREMTERANRSLQNIRNDAYNALPGDRFRDGGLYQ